MEKYRVPWRIVFSTETTSSKINRLNKKSLPKEKNASP
jgi:hypothetical protein